MESNLAVVVIEIAMLLVDALSTKLDDSWFVTVQTTNVRPPRLELVNETFAHQRICKVGISPLDSPLTMRI